MAAQLQIKSLGALVRVRTFTGDGKDRKPVMRQAGFDENGKPLVEHATRLVNLHRGDPVPDDLAPGELDRLKAQDAVGTPADVARVGSRTTERAAAETAAEQTSAPEPELDLDRLGEYDTVELAKLWGSSQPKVKDVLEKVGDNPELAQRALDAEKSATGGDGRVTLVEGLQKVVAGTGGEPGGGDES